MGIALEFMELMRYVHDLGPNDLVIDAGGYDGRWAESIAMLYNPLIVVYEPVPRFADLVRRRHRSNPKVEVKQQALSTVAAPREFRILSNDSGFYGTGARIWTECEDIADVAEKEIALLKLNIEAEEFNILWRLVDTGLIVNVREIQVQFHRDYPHGEFMRHLLRAKLMETHECTYSYPFVWENWRKK